MTDDVSVLLNEIQERVNRLQKVIQNKPDKHHQILDLCRLIAKDLKYDEKVLMLDIIDNEGYRDYLFAFLLNEIKGYNK